MATSWLDFVEETAQDVIGYKVAQLSAPSKPVATNMATGQTYTEGQPASAGRGFNLSPVMMLGGAAVVLLVAFLVLKK